MNARGSLTLQRRLFIFFLLFLVAVMSGIFVILVATGTFTARAQENRVFLENELKHLSANVSNQTGKLTVEGLALAETLAGVVEARQNGEDTNGNAALLNEIMNDALPHMLAALEKNLCSGVYMVLDATVGPQQPHAAYSRAGLFLKNMEPNAINQITPTVRLLRGPSEFAKLEGLEMLPQWQMEFTVQENDFFHKAMQNADGEKALSRLYYWCPAGTLAGDYERSVLFCVPMLSADGMPLGVCGFEMSEMLFKLQHAPDGGVYERIFAMWSPMDWDAWLRVREALFAGAMPPQDGETADGGLSIEVMADGLYRYAAANGDYIGIHKAIAIYPRDAVFAGEAWSVAVMMPEADYSAHIQRGNRWLIGLLAGLLVVSAGAAMLFSKRYLAPVLSALDQITRGTGNTRQAKTRIQEIDDLFAYLAERDAEAVKPATEPQEQARYEAFVRNIETLSPAERAVFNLYTEGYDAKKITELLCLSMNTIKTHNRRIYQKLDVSSRKELLVYVRMMKEKCVK